MFCVNCGRELVSTSKYCNECGCATGTGIKGAQKGVIDTPTVEGILKNKKQLSYCIIMCLILSCALLFAKWLKSTFFISQEYSPVDIMMMYFDDPNFAASVGFGDIAFIIFVFGTALHLLVGIAGAYLVYNVATPHAKPVNINLKPMLIPGFSSVGGFFFSMMASSSNNYSHVSIQYAAYLELALMVVLLFLLTKFEELLQVHKGKRIL